MPTRVRFVMRLASLQIQATKHFGSDQCPRDTLRLCKGDEMTAVEVARLAGGAVVPEALNSLSSSG